MDKKMKSNPCDGCGKTWGTCVCGDKDHRKADYVPLYHCLRFKKSDNVTVYIGDKEHGVIIEQQKGGCIKVDSAEFKEFSRQLVNIVQAHIQEERYYLTRLALEEQIESLKAENEGFRAMCNGSKEQVFAVIDELKQLKQQNAELLEALKEIAKGRRSYCYCRCEDCICHESIAEEAIAKASK